MAIAYTHQGAGNEKWRHIRWTQKAETIRAADQLAASQNWDKTKRLDALFRFDFGISYFIPSLRRWDFFVHRTTHHQKARSASVVMSSFAGNWYSSHVAVMTWRRMPIFRRSFSVARLNPLAGRWSWWTQACEFAFPVRTKKLDMLNSTCILMWGAGEEVRFRLHSFHFCMSESIKRHGRV